MKRRGPLAILLVGGLLAALMFIPSHFTLFPLLISESPVSENMVVKAQELYSPWNRAFGGSEPDVGYGVIEVSSGGFACVGETQSSGAGYNDAWLVRTAADGSPLWSQTFGGSGYDEGWIIVETSTGGFVIAGITTSFGAGSNDFWILGTDATGTLLWNETYGGGTHDICSSMVEVSSGGFALGGTIDYEGIFFGDFWLVRTDSTGTHLWNQTYGGADQDVGEALLEVDSGGFLLAGWTKSIGLGDADVWMVRTDANGNLLWSRNYGAKLTDHAHAVIEVSTGGFLLVGGTTSYGAGDMDVWLIRTDAFGDMVWNQTFGGSGYDVGRSVVELSTGEFALVGTTNSYGDGLMDVWLLVTNSTGHQLSNQTFGGTNTDWAYSLTTVSTGGFAIIGWTKSYGAGNHDLWLLHVTTIGLIPPLSFEFFVVLFGTLIAITTVGVIYVYRKRTAII
ncbi:MAG: hypothetical protein ACXADB_06730 [Candidatus Hermodarchaeia archaeon]|jgi:hypothetical protein